jgi:hypothetical protein
LPSTSEGDETRTLDIAAGTCVAILSIALIASMNPALPKEESAELAQRSNTRNAILGFVRSVGLVWITTSSLRAICDRLAGYDSSVVMNARIGGEGCLPNGGTHYAYSNLSFPIGNSELNLEAWVADARR